MIIIAFAVGHAYAQPQEYKDYTVKKGDTLWDISSKEIVDPFLWPKVWKENPEIRNPDLIYPGQKIRIPLSFLQKEVPPPAEKVVETPPIPVPAPATKPQVKKEEPTVKIRPVRKNYLIERDLLIASGYIAEAIDSKGAVIGSPMEKELLGKDDYAYIRTSDTAKAGAKYYIVRSLGKVKHPKTGAMMGYLIDVRGIAEVVGKESGETKVRITDSYSDVIVGDLLTDYYEIEAPFLVDNPRTLDISGYVVAARHTHVLNGMLDLVYIDRGRNDGIEIGDILEMTARAAFNVPNGYIQIVNIKDATSTAMVMKTWKEVTVGDMIGAITLRSSGHRPIGSYGHGPDY
ncbi:MAG TPA: LysM peptidoglycan-binding domain-containing protein [Thermodesulfovibrionales bacterium]|nr:LysM peptidoglycan-binding domain-containing protein [Thermodesulfovibrionales bacterium]